MKCASKICLKCQKKTQLVELQNLTQVAPNVACSIPLGATIFLTKILAYWHKSSKLTTHDRNEWGITNQTRYTTMSQL